jgi:hypothetical protein
VLDATTPLTATVNTGSSPFTLTSQSIVVADSTNGNLTINLPDLNTIVGTPNQKPIVVYKNDYSQNVIYVNPSGSQLVNGASQDIIVSIQLAVIYNPTSAGWVTEGTSAQSLAELELFFLPLTETGSLATTGSNVFIGNQTITGSLTVTGGINATITGSAASASYVEYANVANKPTLVSGSAQISFNGITDKPTLVSGSSQVSYTGLSDIPASIVSSSTQITGYNIFATTGSNQFNGSQAITGSLTVTGQVVAQTLNVQQVTSSIVYSSGSNVFGNSLSNTQQFTGSLQVSGSSHNILGNVGIGPTGTPVSELQVGKSSDVTIAMSNSSSVTSGNRGSLAWYNSSNSTVANIKATAVTDNVGTQLEFYTRPAAGSLTQVLTISSTGAATFNTTTDTTSISMLSTGTASGLRLQNTGGTASDWIIQSDGGAVAGQAALRFYSITATAYRMSIDGSGNVGIGTTSPGYDGAGYGAVRYVTINNASGTGSNLELATGTTANDGYIGAIDFINTSNTGAPGAGRYGIASIRAYTTNASATNTGGGYLTFNTKADGGSGAERMRITSGGEVSITGINLTVGTGGGAGTLNLDQSTVRRWKLSSGGITSGVFSIINGSDDSPALNISSSNIVSFYIGGGFANQTTLDANTRFQGPNISVAAAKAYAWNTYSDQRIKENINPLPYGLNEILQLNPVSYNQHDSEVIDSEIVLKETYKSTIGLIAQEVNDFIPEAVGIGNDTELWGLDYNKIVPVLVKAIQEQQAQIESLKAEIQTLKQ